jgi:drug/metabolite transporter (DMT)-like permease
MVVAVAALAFHVAALALAPLSVVQAVLAGGLVFLAVLAEWVFGFHLGRREWAGIGITAAGLVFIAITQPSSPHTARVSLAGIIAVEAGALLFAVALMVVAHAYRERLDQAEGMLLGVAAGALFGMADVALKFLSHSVLTRGLFGLLNPWTLSAIIAATLAFYASARSLQIGPGVEVITFTSVAANLTGIGGGILVFGESIGEGALAIVGRVLAFVAVIVGAAIMPAPMRASKHR